MPTRIINPYVFVVGCPRSGTTLLQRMLDAHPDMAIANDTHFITRAVKRTLRTQPTPDMTPELLEQVLAYRRFHRMGLAEEQVREAAAGCETYSGFVSRLYDLRAQQRGKTISGEKTPDYCRQIPVLSRLFPDSKFIHIIRDGRDTALSTLEWANEQKGPGKWELWKSDPVATCALWWNWQVGSGCRDGSLLPSTMYLQIRYEDLVDDPEKHLRRMVDFLHIPYSESMRQFFKGRTRSGEGLSAKAAWIPPTKGLRDWRRQMSDEDVRVFQALAGDQLSSIGYELPETAADGGADLRIERARTFWSERN